MASSTLLDRNHLQQQYQEDELRPIPVVHGF